MSTQATEGVSLSESEIEEIVADIQQAKVFAGHVKEFKFASLNGALRVILCRIDKRIGDAVWME